MKYVKRQVEVEAFKYDGDFMNSNGEYYIPEWGIKAFKCGKMKFVSGGNLVISTLEGIMCVDVGDYIIKGVKGEIYSCKPDIFEETYIEHDEQKYYLYIQLKDKTFFSYSGITEMNYKKIIKVAEYFANTESLSGFVSFVIDDKGKCIIIPKFEILYIEHGKEYK